MHQETLSLKTTKKGARVFLNNGTLANIGLASGEPYKVKYFETHVEVIACSDGNRVVVSGNVIDLETKSMAKTFPDCNRVHVEYEKGIVTLKGYFHDEKIKRRETSIKERVMRKLPLRVVDLCMGVALLSKQISKGLLAAGITTSLVFANEQERLACDIASNWNTEHISTIHPKANVIQDDLFLMDKSLIPECELLIIGYPCVGFSLQQPSEDSKDINHGASGMLFVPLLEAINRSNPALIAIENSDQMINSDTDFIMETVLNKVGYKSTYTKLSGTDFGDFEKRTRMCKVYYSKNLNEFDLKSLTSKVENKRTLADILEPVSDTSKVWRDLSYLKVKNDDHSHGHKFIVPELTSKKLPVFTATYNKTQADSCIIAHPKNPKLHRICSAGEHSNVRRITGNFKNGIVSIANGNHYLQRGRTNQTKAHMLLGNSISPMPWFGLGEFMGNWLCDSYDTPKEKPNFLQGLLAF